MSYSQTILEYLRKLRREQPDKYVPSYDLEKVWIDGKWIGSSGSRRARQLAEDGKIESKT